MKSLPKIIFYCIILGVVFNMVKLYFSQSELELITEEETYPWYFRLGFFGNIFITIASVASFVLYKKYFPSYISACYILLIILVTIASLSDIEAFLKRPTFFYSIKGIGTYVNFGLIFFAADTKYFPKSLKLFYYFSFLVIVGSILKMGQVGFGASRKEYLTAIRDFVVYLIWVFPFFFLQDEKIKAKNLINIGVFLITFLLILASGARSYLLIYAVYIIVKFREQLKTKNALIGIVGIVVLIGAAYVIIINSELSKTVETSVNNLSERSGEDTRSAQLLDFLSQFDIDYLIQGVGPLKQWYWNGIGSLYGYLDNQVLLTAWWAGLPTIAVYLVLLIKSLKTKSEILLFEEIKGTKLVIGLWLVACFGLAIYIAICCDVYYYFISLLIGLNSCQYTKLIELENE